MKMMFNLNFKTGKRGGCIDSPKLFSTVPAWHQDAAKEEIEHETAPNCNSDRNGRILNSDCSGRNSRVLPFRQPAGVQQLSVLSELRIGESGVLVNLDLPESVQNHLMHMGFVPDAHITALRRAPAGDPTVYGVDGMEIGLRIETAQAIHIREVEPSEAHAEAEQELAGAGR